MKFYMLILSSLIFTSCAGLNTSVLETTKPLKKGEKRTGLEIIKAHDLTSAIVFSESDDLNLDNIKFSSLTYTGLIYGIGLEDNFELTGKFSFANRGILAKVFVKHRFNSLSNRFGLAILPGINLVNSSREKHLFGGEDKDSPDISSFGWELALLFDFAFDESFTLYAATRYASDDIHLDFLDDSRFKDADFTLNRTAFVAGFSIESEKSSLRLEAGLESVRAKNVRAKLIPIKALAFAYKF